MVLAGADCARRRTDANNQVTRRVTARSLTELKRQRAATATGERSKKLYLFRTHAHTDFYLSLVCGVVECCQKVAVVLPSDLCECE